MAKEKGFYKEAGLDVDIIERDPLKNNIEQVIDGEAEYGVADSAILLYRAQGKPVKILASIFQHSPLIFLTKKTSNIYSPFEMKGKILSYQKGVDDAPLLALLKSLNIKEEDYKYRPLDFTSNEFIDSKVDVMSAYLSDEPFLMKEKGIEVNIINPLNYGIDFYGDNLFTTESEIKDHSQRVEKFKAASLKGWKYALEHVDETIQILQTKYGDKESLARMQYGAKVIHDMVLPDMVALGYTSKERFYYIAQIYQRIGKANKEQLDKAVESLVYAPDEQNKWVKYFYITVTLLVLAIIVTLSFFLLNQRLKKLVHLKTQKLVQQNKELQNYITLVDKNIITSSTDLKGNIINVSIAFCESSGYTKEELLGKNHRIMKHPDMNPEVYTQIWETITKDHIWFGEIKNKRKNGEFYWLKVSISPTFDELGNKIGYTAIRQDVTDKKIIEEISITDGLTSIYNRRYFNELLPKVINSAKRKNELLNFMIMDIDYFKQYNDTYGHQMGDNVLVQVATTLKNSLNRADDYCFRLGGEEFGILFEADSKAQSIEFTDLIRKNIENLHIPHSASSVGPHITVSIGLICEEANSVLDADMVYKQVDDLLYEAKRGGRNCVVVGD